MCVAACVYGWMCARLFVACIGLMRAHDLRIFVYMKSQSTTLKLCARNIYSSFSDCSFDQREQKIESFIHADIQLKLSEPNKDSTKI